VKAPSRPSPRALAEAAVWAVLIATGLWVSLHQALGAWRADPDIYVPVALWRGVREHGLSFIASWGHTEDNWILSLLPLASAVYEAFGAGPRVAVLIGWAVFVASVGLAAAIAQRLAGGRAAAALAAALLFANYYALGPMGFLAYPVSHDVSMAWGLATLLLAVWSLQRQALAPGLAAGLLVFANAVSDPWANAAISGPLIAASGVLALLHRRTALGRAALALFVSCGVGAWVAYQHPFGLFGFLPRGHFHLGGPDALMANLGYGYRALGVMFEIVPGASLDSRLVIAVSFAALVLMAAAAAVLALLALRRADAARQLVTGVAVLSLGAVTLLYLAGPANQGLYVGRFFANLYFLGPLLAVLAAARFAWARWPIGAYAALIVLSGLAMTPRFWTKPLAPSGVPEAEALGAFLQAHGLTYGYGPYWGVHSLAMRDLTGGAVTIRPVTFRNGRVERRPAETSRLWYAPGAEPPGSRPFLVVRRDPEECAVEDACEAMALRQFGDTVERLPYGDAVILIWARPIAPLIASR
jgi:hypothetical protein